MAGSVAWQWWWESVWQQPREKRQETSEVREVDELKEEGIVRKYEISYTCLCATDEKQEKGDFYFH